MPFSPCGSNAYRRLLAIVLRAAHPNGVAKRLPCWTAVGFRVDRTPPIIRFRESPTSHDLPDPREVQALLIPRITCPSRPFLAHFRHAGSAASPFGGLSPPGQRAFSHSPCDEQSSP